jgi:Fe-S cluster assembly protein SufB
MAEIQTSATGTKANAETGSEFAAGEYKYGFTTPVEMEAFTRGLSEQTIRDLSAKKEEPAFLLEFRLKAYRKWLTMKEPEWAHVDYPPIDYQNIAYFVKPKQKPQLAGLDEVDPEILKTFERLGIPLDEQKKLANVAVDAVFDSVSVPPPTRKN